MAIFKSKGDPAKITAGEIRKKFDESNKMLQKEQWTYVINRAFLYNEQWLNYNRIQNNVAAIPREPDRLRVTQNRLWPASRHLMSKLLSRPLVFEVAPNMPDDASIRGAHIAEAVLEELVRYQNWEGQREQLAWDAWLGGTSFLALDWDQNTKGKYAGDREDGSPIMTGDICTTALNILEVGWEPGARSLEQAYWWVRAQALPPETVKTMYDLEKTPEADAGAAQGYMGRTMVVEESGRPRPDLTLVLTYYERPCKSRPSGAIATVIGDQIVDGPHPWNLPFTDRLNVVAIRETKVSGKAQGDTVFSAAVPVQVQYNQAWSNLLEHLKMAGQAILLSPDAALDDIEEISDIPGAMLQYNSAGGAPSWLTPPGLPEWVVKAPQMLAAQMDDILGIHDVSRGIAPSNIESGVGLSVLVEQDTTPLGALTREMAYAYGRFACLVLETYAAKAVGTRVARMKAQGVPEVVEWDGPALAGQTVAEVPVDAVMPRSRTALMAFAKELWDRKIIQDPQTFTRMADLPDQDDLLDAIDSNAAKAQRENRDMAVGRIRVPRDFDDHKKHIQHHNEFRRTLRYETLTPEWQLIVDDHIEAHETMAAEELGEQAAKMNVHPAFASAATANEAPLLPGQQVPGMSGAGAPMGASAPGPTSGRPAEAQAPGLDELVPQGEGQIPS